MKKFKGSIYQQEFIGRYAEVIDSEHNGFKKVRGKIVDETMNTLMIEDESGISKMIPKKGNTFKIKIEKSDYLVEGNKILHRPEDRIKKAG